MFDSEFNSLCKKDCYYLIPIYEYDKLSSMTMSVSDENLKNNLKVELQFHIFKSFKNYKNITYKEYGENFLLKSDLNITSNKNYIIYKNNNNDGEDKDFIIFAHVKILNSDLNNKIFFPVHFTYNKKSHSYYFLYPGRNNLLFIEKNIENIDTSLDKKRKIIRLPEYYLLNYQQKKQASLIKFSLIKGEGVVQIIINNIYTFGNRSKLYSDLKSFVFDKYHSFQINYNRLSKFTKAISIYSDKGLYTYATLNTNLRPNLNEVLLGKENFILHHYDSNALNMYISINNLSQIQNDISINLKIEGFIINEKYDWELKGFLIKKEMLENKEYENLDDKNVCIGFFDDIINMGMIIFKKDDMVKYYNNNKKDLVLLIKLINKNYLGQKYIDIVIKAIALPNKISFNSSKEINEFSLPSFVYFFSYIPFKEENLIYKLSNIKKNHNFISIEFVFSNDKIGYAIYGNKTELSNDIKNNKIRNKFEIFDQRSQNGKKSIIINYNNITEIFLIIYKDLSINVNVFFGFKYYSFSQDEYKKGKYLYKNRFNLTGTKISLKESNNNSYLIEWCKIGLLKNKPEKVVSRIDYYVKIKINNNDTNINNSGLFLNYKEMKDINVKGMHLINKNKTKIVLIRNDMKNITVYLIAKFNELNGMENYIVYQPACIQKKQYEETNNGKNENDNNINNDNNNLNNKGENKKIFLKMLVYLFGCLIIICAILYLYKTIRRIQIKMLNEKNRKKSIEKEKEQELLSIEYLIDSEDEIKKNNNNKSKRFLVNENKK